MIGFVVVWRVVVTRFEVVINFVVLVQPGFVVVRILYIWILTENFNPQAPIAQKIADELVFRRFQGEGSSFSKSDLTDSLSDF